MRRTLPNGCAGCTWQPEGRRGWVGGNGPEQADLVIVGEGPGSQETTLQIVESPTAVVVRQEAMHDSQIAYLDGRPLPPAEVHLDKGVSRAHWEGDTLVVDSSNFGP